MSEDLTVREALLIELVWILAYGTETEQGLSLSEIMTVLDSRLKTRELKTVLEVLETEGHSFIKEMASYLKDQ